MILQAVSRSLMTGSSVVGCCVATLAAGGTVSAQTMGRPGYAYVCDGPVKVQAVKEGAGYEVVIVDGIQRPNSPNGMFEIFQASRPEMCATMTAPLTGAVPGTLLVAVTWAVPQLSTVRARTAQPHKRCTGATCLRIGRKT